MTHPLSASHITARKPAPAIKAMFANGTSLNESGNAESNSKRSRARGPPGRKSCTSEWNSGVSASQSVAAQYDPATRNAGIPRYDLAPFRCLTASIRRAIARAPPKAPIPFVVTSMMLAERTGEKHCTPSTNTLIATPASVARTTSRTTPAGHRSDDPYASKAGEEHQVANTINRIAPAEREREGAHEAFVGSREIRGELEVRQRGEEDDPHIGHASREERWYANSSRGTYTHVRLRSRERPGAAE